MTTGIFADLTSIYTPVKKIFGAKVDYGKVLNELSYDYIVRAIAYSTQSESEASSFVIALRCLGYTTKFKKDYDWRIILTLDVVTLAPKIQKAVFITNEECYHDLYDWCRYQGIFVHVFNANEYFNYPVDQHTLIQPNLLEMEMIT
jgi:NYN domain-containing protein